MPKTSAQLEGYWNSQTRTLPPGTEIIERDSGAPDEAVIEYRDANGNYNGDLIVSREALQAALRKVTAE